MKQIGARQEAGRIGGTGPCGRELCCATWMKNFSSVSTTAARIQDISLNPTKLTGMCAKLKCCLNYEVDDYMEAGRKLPSREVVLETMDGEYYLFKTDILNGQCTYSTDKNLAANLETISAERAKEIIELNRRGEKPLSLLEDGKAKPAKKPVDLLAGADLSRFDKAKKRKKNNQPRNNNGQQGGRPQRDNRRNQRDGQDNYRQQNDNRRPQNDNRRPQNGNRRPYNGPRPAHQQNEGTAQNNRNEGRQPQQTERTQE